MGESEYTGRAEFAQLPGFARSSARQMAARRRLCRRAAHRTIRRGGAENTGQLLAVRIEAAVDDAAIVRLTGIVERWRALAVPQIVTLCGRSPFCCA